MTHRIEAARFTATSILGGGANYIAVASAASGLAQQLNQTHPFLYLDLPIWIFFAGALVLAMIGSIASLFIDMLATPPLSPFRLGVNLMLGFFTGIVGAFVVLPSFTSSPTMPLLLLTALSMSFLGTVVVRNIGEILRSAELWRSIKALLSDSVIEALQFFKDVLMERLKLLAAVFFGGHKK